MRKERIITAFAVLVAVMVFMPSFIGNGYSSPTGVYTDVGSESQIDVGYYSIGLYDASGVVLDRPLFTSSDVNYTENNGTYIIVESTVVNGDCGLRLAQVNKTDNPQSVDLKVSCTATNGSNNVETNIGLTMLLSESEITDLSGYNNLNILTDGNDYAPVIINSDGTSDPKIGTTYRIYIIIGGTFTNPAQGQISLNMTFKAVVENNNAVYVATSNSVMVHITTYVYFDNGDGENSATGSNGGYVTEGTPTPEEGNCVVAELWADENMQHVVSVGSINQSDFDVNIVNGSQFCIKYYIKSFGLGLFSEGTRLKFTVSYIESGETIIKTFEKVVGSWDNREYKGYLAIDLSPSGNPDILKTYDNISDIDPDKWIGSDSATDITVNIQGFIGEADTSIWKGKATASIIIKS